MKVSEAVVIFLAGLTSAQAARGGKKAETPAPTPAPTPPPPSSLVPCPEPLTGHFDLSQAGLVEIGKSSIGRLCTLVLVSPNDDGFTKAVGRSYEGLAWESVAGDFASLNFDCSTGTWCSVILPVPAAGYKYSLVSYEHSLKPEDEYARFLEQTTFGPTRAEIAGFPGYAQWVQNQLSLPMSSHRQFFRQHILHRHDTTMIEGLVTRPCQVGTRYRKFAFSEKDRNRYLQIETSSTGYKILSISGQRRTVIKGLIQKGSESAPDASAVPFPDGSYRICSRPDDGLGGRIRLFIDGSCADYVWFDGFRGNPEVFFDVEHPPTFPIVKLDAHSEPFGSEYYGGATQELYINSPVTDGNCNLLPTPAESPEIAVVGTTSVDGLEEYWLHSPSFDLLDNDLSSPAPDGGNAAVKATENAPNRQYKSICANAPRTFLNEDTCAISYDGCIQKDVGDKEFELNIDTFKEIYDGSGGDDGELTRYVYVVDNLRQEGGNKDDPPCKPGARSRWRPVLDDPECISGVDSITEDTIASLISTVEDSNPYMRDIVFPVSQSCGSQSVGSVGFRVKVGSQCWLNTHIDNLQVYDMTVWTAEDTHPGNSDGRNPIEEFAETGTFTLLYPEWHDMGRWRRKKEEYDFPNLGRFGDKVFLQQLPTDVIPEYAAALGLSGIVPEGGAVTVCGSPFETANELSLYGQRRKGGFDMATWKNRTTFNSDFSRQRVTTWMELALSAPDQFRGRVAWALYQLFAISPDAIDYSRDKSEPFLAHYDIFVRHAFGNYRDILKENSYSPVMGEMLTYRDSKSTGYKWTRATQVLEFPDENFAREVMQLFSIGLYKLNPDGTRQLDSGGVPIRAYTNEEITEYARAWTGFERNVIRGNLEKLTSGSDNQVDPMNIRIDYRDHLPKMGLDHKYVGEGYPLCSDLPAKHFLQKGATFLLRGVDSSPERLREPSTWTGSAAKRLLLSTDSVLSQKLCAATGKGKNIKCTFPAKVVLDEDISCRGIECDLDSLRTFEVQPGIFYEYVRAPCVHQAFYNDAKLIRRKWSSQGKQMCSDPRMESASTTCCNNATNTWSSREGAEMFSGERVSFLTASDRCAALGKTLCYDPSLSDAECGNINIGGCDRDGVEYWSSTPCSFSAKIDGEGKIAIIHDVEDAEKMVRRDTKMFFRVEWGDETGINALLQSYDRGCSAEGCVIDEFDGFCICPVNAVIDTPVFANDDEIINAPIDDLLSRLPIGALPPPTTIQGMTVKEGVTKYPATNLQDTVFAVVDQNGITHHRKNLKSDVNFGNGTLSFRNPVHFISLSDPEKRDAMYETEAVLDQYFYHANTAPFLSIRFAKRFGISNPSPGFISRIANAFRTGRYVDALGSIAFGSGEYGDLAATFAALVLDRESRNVLLDADPTHGSLREPFLKIVHLMRSLEFESAALDPFILIEADLQDSIGQQPHQIPSVFSFFRPDFQPSGPVQKAGLTSPEAQVMTGPKSVNLMNAILSFLKYGLNRCDGGFGAGLNNCNSGDIGNNPDAEGNTTLVPNVAGSVRSNIDGLATLLTGGRLSEASRVIIEEAYHKTLNDGETDLEAFIDAQQLIASSPEFHTNSLAKQSAGSRDTPEQPGTSSQNYKAVVFLMLAGGYDSFNMLVPHSCTGTNAANQTVLDQYEEQRGAMAFEDTERSLTINATGQPCDSFALHDELSLFKQLYDKGDLSFFANTGVINNNGMTKSNYRSKTKTQLFAHDAMQEETKKVDPFDVVAATGVLGRAAGVLRAQGRSVQSWSIDNPSIAVDGVAGVAPSPLIVSRYGPKPFNPGAVDQKYLNFTKYFDKLNNKTTSIYGETWSGGFLSGVQDAEDLKTYLDSVDLSEDIWYNADGSRNEEGGSDLWYKFSTIYKLLETRFARGSDHDNIYVQYGGWDHHYQMKNSIRPKFRALNHGLDLFFQQLKATGLWDNVTIVVTSDFARTITPNSGVGSDHAWGGHYPLMGGSVKGGRIHGEYPYDITPNGPLNIGRGRIIPTLPWDAVWNGVIDHMGVPDIDKDTVLPNRANTFDASTDPRFGLFTKDDLFKSSTANSPPHADNIFLRGTETS